MIELKQDNITLEKPKYCSICGNKNFTLSNKKSQYIEIFNMTVKVNKKYIRVMFKENKKNKYNLNDKIWIKGTRKIIKIKNNILKTCDIMIEEIDSYKID